MVTKRLAAAKQEAVRHLNDLHDLNEAQRHALTTEINNSNNIAAVNQAKDKANTVNTAMTGLKHSIADNEQELRNGNYINADKDKQDAYNSAVNNAKQVINQANNDTAQLNPTEINKLAQKVNTTKQELNGNEKLAEAKREANTTIDGLTYLNDAQRAKAKQNVGNATTRTDIASQLGNYTKLNNAMKELRDSVQNVNQIKQVAIILMKTMVLKKHIIKQ